MVGADLVVVAVLTLLLSSLIDVIVAGANDLIGVGVVVVDDHLGGVIVAVVVAGAAAEFVLDGDDDAGVGGLFGGDVAEDLIAVVIGGIVVVVAVVVACTLSVGFQFQDDNPCKDRIGRLEEAHRQRVVSQFEANFVA